MTGGSLEDKEKQIKADCESRMTAIRNKARDAKRKANQAAKKEGSEKPRSLLT